MNAQSKVKATDNPNIAQRINAAMAEVEYIQKQKPKDQGMKYTYVSHDAVTAKVRPILQGHGVVYYPRDLAVTQNGNRTEAVFNVRFENIDDRTDYIDVATFGYGVDNQDKGPGKAMSYGIKYALLKVLGLETGDDPEEVQDARADHKPSATPGLIDDDQLGILQGYASAGVIDAQRFCNFFQIPSLDKLPAAKFDEAIGMAKAKAEKIKEPVQ
jgi:hypothetical protein